MWPSTGFPRLISSAGSSRVKCARVSCAGKIAYTCLLNELPECGFYFILLIAKIFSCETIRGGVKNVFAKQRKALTPTLPGKTKTPQNRTVHVASCSHEYSCMSIHSFYRVALQYAIL